MGKKRHIELFISFKSLSPWGSLTLHLSPSRCLLSDDMLESTLRITFSIARKLWWQIVDVLLEELMCLPLPEGISLTQCWHLALSMDRSPQWACLHTRAPMYSIHTPLITTWQTDEPSRARPSVQPEHRMSQSVWQAQQCDSDSFGLLFIHADASQKPVPFSRPNAQG